ncbi:MAG: hypothetical protein OEW97_01995 [Gammaproteobacteria bacterium]|nr:hypothetical protein [Gammaproteobacteria bacterium]
MAIALCDPEIGLWYRDIQNRLFEVVAVDSEDSIEIQYYDGDVAEFDRESWDLLCVNVVSEPGDGLGPYDDESEEDTYFLDDLHSVSWDSVIVEGEN